MNNTQGKKAGKKPDHYVYSTLSNDQTYTAYVDRGKDNKSQGPNVVEARVLIKGQVNVVDSVHLMTPKGRVTPISQEEYEILHKNEVFLKHKKNGFIVVEKTEENPETVAQLDMEAKDQSAPLTKEDYKKVEGDEERPSPVVNTQETKNKARRS